MTNHLRGHRAAMAIPLRCCFSGKEGLSRWCPRVSGTLPLADGEGAEKIRDAKEVIEMVIVVLREAGLPVPIELSEAARALSRELRPKAIRLERVTIN